MLLSFRSALINPLKCGFDFWHHKWYNLQTLRGMANLHTEPRHRAPDWSLNLTLQYIYFWPKATKRLSIYMGHKAAKQPINLFLANGHKSAHPFILDHRPQNGPPIYIELKAAKQPSIYIVVQGPQAAIHLYWAKVRKQPINLFWSMATIRPIHLYWTIGRWKKSHQFILG